MEDQILKIIQTIGNNGEHVGPDQELLESGILDSLAFIMLLEKISDRWGIEIQPTQVEREAFRTAAGIVELCKTFAREAGVVV